MTAPRSTVHHPLEGTPPEEILAEIMSQLTVDVLPHVRAVLRGKVSDMEYRAILRAKSGRGLLVTLTLTALDPGQTVAAMSTLGEAGRA